MTQTGEPSKESSEPPPPPLPHPRYQGGAGRPSSRPGEPLRPSPSGCARDAARSAASRTHSTSCRSPPPTSKTSAQVAITYTASGGPRPPPRTTTSTCTPEMRAMMRRGCGESTAVTRIARGPGLVHCGPRPSPYGSRRPRSSKRQRKSTAAPASPSSTRAWAARTRGRVLRPALEQLQAEARPRPHGTSSPSGESESENGLSNDLAVGAPTWSTRKARSARPRRAAADAIAVEAEARRIVKRAYEGGLEAAGAARTAIRLRPGPRLEAPDQNWRAPSPSRNY